MLPLLLAIIFLPSAPAGELFRQVRPTRTLTPRRLNAPVSRVVPMALVVEAGSRWDNDVVLQRHLDKSAGIFARCGVELGEVEISTVALTAAAEAALRVSDPYAGATELALMSDVDLPTRRPLGFLTGVRRHYSTASAFNVSSVRSLSTPTRDHSPLLNTFHITANFENDATTPGATAAYSTFAHELTHILGNLPHVAIPRNLMTNVDGRGTHTGDLNAEQCAAILSHQL